MRKKIFYGIFLVSLLTLTVALAVFCAFSYFDYKDSTEKQLSHEALYISKGISKAGDDYFRGFESQNNRVTWIDGQGNVLYDSQIVDVSLIENHIDRSEVSLALENGVGVASRYSDTLEKMMMYYALRLDDGSVIRVASDIPTVYGMLLDFFPTLIIVAAIAFAFSFLLSRKVAKKIVKPINEINPECPDITEEYAEAAPLIHKIKEQNKFIAEQMEKLSRQRKEFAVITENMNEGFIIASVDMELLSYNGAALNLLGYCGRINENENILNLNRSEQFVSAVEGAINGHGSEVSIKTENKMCRIITNPVVSDNNVSGFIMVIIDVSETQQREKLRREFSSNVSHELKTPLTSIYGISDMLVSGLVKSEDINSFALSIKNEAGRLISLIDDIIRLSKLDESDDSGIEFERSEIDLYNVANDVVQRLAENNSRGIDITLDGQNVVIEGVYSVIDEMIYNLCENAIKYNKDNGRVFVTVTAKKNNAVITVRDTGIGIPASEVDRIFERFYRVDKSHSKKIGGTGLGLSIVKHAALFHGGNVRVQSALGEGSTFIVELPLNKQ